MTSEEIMQERIKWLEQARTWIGTPYHPNARLKGQGADCITFIAGAVEEAGLLPHIAMPNYSRDWMLHGDREIYLEGDDVTPGLLKYCDEVEPPPLRNPIIGDIVVWKFGRTFSHGALVIDWPTVIHCINDHGPYGRIGDGAGVQITDVSRIPRFKTQNRQDLEPTKPRPVRVFVLKRWAQ